jgi:hypothetical protein
MKTILITFASFLICQSVLSQTPELVIDRGDSMFYQLTIPENLKALIGSYGTDKATDGYLVLNENGKGTYRYPSFGFATKNCPVEDIQITSWGIRCTRNGKIEPNKYNDSEYYSVVLVTNGKKFEACITNAKEVSAFFKNGKIIMGLDTQWGKK